MKQVSKNSISSFDNYYLVKPTSKCTEVLYTSLTEKEKECVLAGYNKLIVT